MSPETIAVLGGGNGAKTIAADMALAGYRVRLYELPQFIDNIKQLMKNRRVTLLGERCHEGSVELESVTTNIAEAITGSNLILIVVPCYGHKLFSENLVPYMAKGQMICFVGEGGGALQLSKTAKEKGVVRDVIIGETNTLPYQARLVDPVTVKARLKKGGTLAAAFPAQETGRLVAYLNKLWPFLLPAENVLETILLNFNAIDHVATVVLNAGRIEGSTSEMSLWHDGATPSVVRCIEGVDGEILQIRKALGFKDQTRYKDWLHKQGVIDAPKPTTYEAIHASSLGTLSPFRCGPEALKHRYITEDVPFSLVLIASIGDLVGVETPVIDALITLASTINQTDYWTEGRTIWKLGVPRLEVKALLKYLNEGKTPKRTMRK